MRIPVQDIPIVNNHPVNFERRIWPKSHPRAASVLAKIHGREKKKDNKDFYKLIILSIDSYFKYNCMGSSCISWCYDCSIF